MTRQPSVSVVIPNWNGREHLRTCLTSLLALDYPSELVDMVVVDNGSTDGSVELVGSVYPRARILRNPSNTGFASACDQGAEASTAEFVAFLNNDVRVDPAWLSELVAVADSAPEIAAVGSLVLDWDGTHIDFARSGLTPMCRGLQLGYGQPVADAPREPQEQLFANGAAMLVRREAFLEAGGFDRRFFAYFEDVDLGWRQWILGWRVLVAPGSRVFHRHHGTSGRLREAQMEYLVARNGVMVAVKNLEDATLAALLPVLLLEIVSSVATGSGIRNQRYWIPGFEQSAFEPHSPRLGGGPATARGRTHTLKPGSAMARAAAKRAISEVNRYLPVLTPRAGARVAALEDVLHGWPELMATRSTIQSRRRRSEAEIATLFGLDEQTREPTGYPALDKTTAAVYRALEAVGLERLLPRA